MKKFSGIISALVLAAALSGCDVPAENSDTSSAVTEDTTAAAAETSAAEETSGTRPMTEQTEETSSETVVNAENTDFPVGEWYENRAYIYNFDENGNVSIDTGFYNVQGTYKCENGLMSICLKDDGGEELRYEFEITENNGEYELDLTGDSGKPYEPAGFATDWIDAGYPSDGNGFILKKGDAPRPAGQKDILGLWVYEDWLIRFDEDGCAFFTPDMEKTDGTITDGVMPGSEDIVLTYYEDKIFVNDETSAEPDIMTRAVSAAPELSDFDGRFTLAGNMDGLADGMVTVENGNIVPYYEDVSCGTLSVNGNKAAVTNKDGETAGYDCYFVNETIYLINGDSYISMSGW